MGFLSPSGVRKDILWSIETVCTVTPGKSLHSIIALPEMLQASTTNKMGCCTLQWVCKKWAMPNSAILPQDDGNTCRHQASSSVSVQPPPRSRPTMSTGFLFSASFALCSNLLFCHTRFVHAWDGDHLSS